MRKVNFQSHINCTMSSPSTPIHIHSSNKLINIFMKCHHHQLMMSCPPSRSPYRSTEQTSGCSCTLPEDAPGHIRFPTTPIRSASSVHLRIMSMVHRNLLGTNLVLPKRKKLISLLTSSVINLSSTHLLVPSTQKDIVNSLSPTCCPEPPLTPLIGQYLNVHLLQYRRHRTLSMSCPTPARNCRHLARQFHLFPGQANR